MLCLRFMTMSISFVVGSSILFPLAAAADHQVSRAHPHIVLVMADDMGWGQTGYQNHPVLKTPHLDEMAENGLRFNRFYAAGPVCSPTRASVLTGRSHRRTGVETHGYALRRQEHTLAQELKEAGYVTGHFGKWHLNGMRGPGVPIFATDSHHPGVFGFDHWLSVTNFFDRDPVMSRKGTFVEFKGDSSEIIVDQACDFIAANLESGKPTFSVIWYGTPHSPFRSAPEDAKPFRDLNEDSKNHYGELVAMDRSIGTLRRRLREMGIDQNTLIWFTSDNGGLPKIKPDTVGGLRGFKGSLYEGGLRVPTIIEWPGKILPRITDFPAVSSDIVPTVVEILARSGEKFVQPQDGISLVDLFQQEISIRSQPIRFSYTSNTAIIDNQYKMLELGAKNKRKATLELYDVVNDPNETNDLYQSNPETAKRMEQLLRQWQSSLANSKTGADYPEGKVNAGEPEPQQWIDLEIYRPYYQAWKDRPEYRSRIRPKLQGKQ